MTKHDNGPMNKLILDSHCVDCPAQNKAICSALSPEFSRALAGYMIHRRFGKNEIIWGEGEDNAYFAIIVSGAVKLVNSLPDGRQQIVGMLFPSDCLGDLFVDEHTSFAEAVSHTELCCFPQKEFERALKNDPALEHALLERTFRELVATRQWLATIGRLSAGGRLANFLVSLMEKAGRVHCQHLKDDCGECIFEIPMSRADIADYLGLTLETVSRQFSRLKNSGIIDIRDVRTIEVHDPTALCAMAGY